MPIDERMVDYGYGKIIPNYTVKDEASLAQQMAKAISEYYEQSGLKKTFECDKPGERFGWKIDSQGVRIVGCGCYDDAVWPIIASLGISALIKKVGADLIVPKIVKQINENIIVSYIAKTRTALKKFFDKIENSVNAVVERVLARGVRQQQLAQLIFGDKYNDILEEWTQIVAMHIAKIQGIHKAMLEDDEFIKLFIDNIASKDLPEATRISRKNAAILAYQAEQRQVVWDLQDELEKLWKRYTRQHSGKPVPGFPNGINNAPEDPIIKEFFDNFNGKDDSDLLRTVGKFLYENEQSFLEETAIQEIVTYAAGLLGFALGVFSYLNVVVDKECSTILTDDSVRSYTSGPSDKNIDPAKKWAIEDVVDRVYFSGLWKGTSSWGKNIKKICPDIVEALGKEPSWDKVYEVLIANRLPVWPTKDDMCECSECPSGYSLCSYSNLLNGYTDVYNICLPVCGGLEAKPLDPTGISPDLTVLGVKSNCNLGCPDGYMWVPCSESNCPEKKPCKDNDTDKAGFCVKIPDRVANLIKNDIDYKRYGPILWDPVSCRWVCRNGTHVMDWTKSDNYGADKYPEGPVSPEDERFSKTIYIPASGPGGKGFFTPMYRFRADRLIYEGCPENSMRILEKNCECECLDCSGSYFEDNNDYGIPEVPEGYILYDNTLIPLTDFDETAAGDSCDQYDDYMSNNSNIILCSDTININSIDDTRKQSINDALNNSDFMKNWGSTLTNEDITRLEKLKETILQEKSIDVLNKNIQDIKSNLEQDYRNWKLWNNDAGGGRFKSEDELRTEFNKLQDTMLVFAMISMIEAAKDSLFPKWTDESNTVSFDGEFIRIEINKKGDKWLIIRDENGKERKVPYRWLSPESKKQADEYDCWKSSSILLPPASINTQFTTCSMDDAIEDSINTAFLNSSCFTSCSGTSDTTDCTIYLNQYKKQILSKKSIDDNINIGINIITQNIEIIEQESKNNNDWLDNENIIQNTQNMDDALNMISASIDFLSNSTWIDKNNKFITKGRFIETQSDKNNNNRKWVVIQPEVSKQPIKIPYDWLSPESQNRVNDLCGS